MSYEPIIGLEVHIQPKTKSKMFCSCSAEYFGAQPNTHTCPVCLGLPGAMPVPNKVSLEKCIKLALAMNCSISKQSKFDRKSYFYPDLPKGYQISQYEQPIGYDGYIELDIGSDAKRIRITRVHQEEDTGKSMHSGNETLLDFNKSGVPLIELVTEPDFTDVKEIDVFAKRLRQTVRYLKISDADMEKGQMRFELNISLREAGSKKLPKYKVEVKNIGSISVLKKVIQFEISRQTKILNKGEKPVQETRGLRDMTGKTYSQRIKEGSADYRYFPEPDIPPLVFSKDLIAQVKKTIEELPGEKKMRYIHELELEPDTAETIISSKDKAVWFENTINGIDDNKLVKQIARLYIGDLFGLMRADKKSINEVKITSAQLFTISNLLYTGRLSGSLAKQVIKAVYETGDNPEKIIRERKLKVVGDKDELTKIVDVIIKDNPKVIKSIEKNPNAIKFLLGQVMRETQGKADPRVTMEILEKKLKIQL